MKKIIIIALFLVFLAVSQYNTIVDIDLWWTLKTGEYILAAHDVPREDIFSYTLEGTSWVDHEWLSQVVMSPLFKKWGWRGINALKCVVIGLCFMLMLFLASGGFKKIFFPALFLFLSVFAFGYRSVARPEIFSYLFFCVFLFLLEKKKWLFALPFLEILWVNMHGYFVVGPMLVFLYVISSFISGERRLAGGLFLLLVITSLAAFINPYFYEGALYPAKIILQAFTSQKGMMSAIHELRMPVADNFGRYVFLWLLAVAAATTFLINIKKARPGLLLAFAAGFAAMYLAVRNIPFFVFPAFLAGSVNLNEALSNRKRDTLPYYVFLCILALFCVYLFGSNRYYYFTNQEGIRKTEARFSPFFMPSGACDFLEKNALVRRMFNTLDFGPYIGYRFYPRRVIFIDTRTELYGDKFYDIYRRAQNYPGDWERIQGRYGFDIALIRHIFSGTERLLRFLHRSPEWRLVYYDAVSALFLKEDDKNKTLIERYGIGFDGRTPTEEDINLNTALFFQKIGESDMAEKAYKGLLKKDPLFLEAANNLANIYVNSGRYREAISLVSRFLKRYPRAAELYANMGAAYMELGQLDKAVWLLRRSAALEPYLRQAAYLLGIAYFRKGELDRASRQFIKYLNLDPFNPRAHRLLGDVYAARGLMKMAEREYREADKLEGGRLDEREGKPLYRE